MILSRFSTYIRLNDKMGFARLGRAGRAGLAASAAIAGIICAAAPAQAMCALPHASPFQTLGPKQTFTKRFDLTTGATAIIAFGDEAGYKKDEPYAIEISVVKGGGEDLCSPRAVKAERPKGSNSTICQFNVSGDVRVEVTATNEGSNPATFTLVCANQLGYLALGR